MEIGHEIRLNFLALNQELQPFSIYRRERHDEGRPGSSVRGYTLPVGDNHQQRAKYWVSFDAIDGFDEATVSPAANRFLTQHALFEALVTAAKQHADQLPVNFEVPKGGFYREVLFNCVEHDEGFEQLVVHPYYLRERKCFGWRVEFHFRLREGVPFNRRVQKLSLSLDESGRRNLNTYMDRARRIKSFLKIVHPVLQSCRLPGANDVLAFDDSFALLSAKRLDSKVYLFAGNAEATNQFAGLVQHGPKDSRNVQPELLFAFRESDRPSARKLAAALQGGRKRERYSFPGFNNLFDSDVQISSSPVLLNDLSRNSFELACGEIVQRRSIERQVLPIFVLPDNDENGYIDQKAIFAHAGIPTQVCTLRIINDDYALKWALANIALQIFCKCGGTPWTVKPTKTSTLIIGVSQSHEMVGEGRDRRVSRYFAFSVMTDNSGLFQKLQVLGESEHEKEYLASLNQNLKQVLASASGNYSRVVIHTTYKLKHSEMRAIESVVRDASEAVNDHETEFAVIKVNQRNSFSGFNPNANSLVPYEGTACSLGGGEYLVWFEGLLPGKTTVTKAFPGPTHVAITQMGQHAQGLDDYLLQDLINLSGANWRGFNARSEPVSTYYCHIIAKFVRRFHAHNLPLPRIEELRPWFL